MKTAWDYTTLAHSYLKRPDYAPSALEEIFRIAGLHADDLVCDIGAGVAHFTLPLVRFGCRVDAVEPNDAMRALGMQRTADCPGVMAEASPKKRTNHRPSSKRRTRQGTGRLR